MSFSYESFWHHFYKAWNVLILEIQHVRLLEIYALGNIMPNNYNKYILSVDCTHIIRTTSDRIFICGTHLHQRKIISRYYVWQKVDISPLVALIQHYDMTLIWLWLCHWSPSPNLGIIRVYRMRMHWADTKLSYFFTLLMFEMVPKSPHRLWRHFCRAPGDRAIMLWYHITKAACCDVITF